MSSRWREVVLEIRAVTDEQAAAADTAAASLRGLPGVIEAHVDEHRTWSMVTYDPQVTTIAAIAGCLAVQGLQPSRVQPLVTDFDACE